MNANKNHWSKKELQTYILFLCADADSIVTEEELNLIKSKVEIEIFNKIYKEFGNDTEDERFEKIEDNINRHEYTNQELSQLRKEMLEIFFTDSKLSMMEANLNRIMDNMLY